METKKKTLAITPWGRKRSYKKNGLNVMSGRTTTDKQQGNPKPDSEQIKRRIVEAFEEKTIHSKNQARISKSEIWNIEQASIMKAGAHP